MIIGRNLSKLLSIGKDIGKYNLVQYDSDDNPIYTLTDICEALDRIVLPLQPMGYATRVDETTGEEKITVQEDNLYFSRFKDSDGDIKRALSKAFDKRRKVKVGETFTMKRARLKEFGFCGIRPIDYLVNRVDNNAVEITENHYGGNNYLVSSSREGLIKNRKDYLKPVLYKGVLF